MVTDDLISEVYIKRVVSKHKSIIYETQAAVVDKYFNNGTGRLKSYLLTMPFDINGTSFHFKVLPYCRFLDMRTRTRTERREMALYNRVIWGVLYHETMPALMYGLTKDIRDSIGAELRKAEEVEQYYNW